MRAIWKDTVLAESDRTVVVEGNHYFPIDSIDCQYFANSDTRSHCPWKGDASYYHIAVNGEKNPDAAWYYSDPKDTARDIKGYVAFWRGVQISD